ncbi:MAG: hypothetical protein WBW94_17380 [Anaerolineales bacterium]
MTKNLYPTDVVKQAQSVQDAWDQIKADMTFGDLTLGMLTADITQSDPLEQQITNLETQLTNLRNERDALYVSIWEKVKRVRAGVKGNFGDDSSQYEMVGGTRLSERKSPTRKAATKTT